MSEGDLHIPPTSMGQAVTVLADIVCSYVSGMQPQGSAPGDDLKTYHQIAISMFLHQLLMRSQHKTEMAGILDAIAAELRDLAPLSGAPASPEVERCPGGVDPGWDECPKCGAMSDDTCRQPLSDTHRPEDGQ